MGDLFKLCHNRLETIGVYYRGRCKNNFIKTFMVQICLSGRIFDGHPMFVGSLLTLFLIVYDDYIKFPDIAVEGFSRGWLGVEIS